MAYGQLPAAKRVIVVRVTAEDDESFTFESAVRRIHVFKRIWTPVNGQVLQIRAETGNDEDASAVATVHNITIFGRMPREISRTAFYFLQHGGCITWKMTGRRKL